MNELTWVEVGLLLTVWGLCGLLTFLITRRKYPTWVYSHDLIPFVLFGLSPLMVEILVFVVGGLVIISKRLGDWLHKVNIRF